MLWSNLFYIREVGSAFPDPLSSFQRQRVARIIPYILESIPHPNLIRTSFCRFLKRKKKLVRSSNPQLLCKSRGGCRLHGKPSRRALSSDISRSDAQEMDGSEDDILWEDDGEDKDDSDWVTDNISVMSDDGESYE